MRVLLDLEQYHRMGSHCLTTCLVTLFRQQGIGMPEEMSLGLGSGLGFTYVRQKGGFMYGGRGGNLEQNLASSLGLELVANRTQDKDIAWEYNRQMLLGCHPLICEVDMAHSFSILMYVSTSFSRKYSPFLYEYLLNGNTGNLILTPCISGVYKFQSGIDSLLSFVQQLAYTNRPNFPISEVSASSISSTFNKLLKQSVLFDNISASVSMLV